MHNSFLMKCVNNMLVLYLLFYGCVWCIIYAVKHIEVFTFFVVFFMVISIVLFIFIWGMKVLDEQKKYERYLKEWMLVTVTLFLSFCSLTYSWVLLLLINGEKMLHINNDITNILQVISGIFNGVYSEIELYILYQFIIFMCTYFFYQFLIVIFSYFCKCLKVNIDGLTVNKRVFIHYSFLVGFIGTVALGTGIFSGNQTPSNISNGLYVVAMAIFIPYIHHSYAAINKEKQ